MKHQKILKPSCDTVTNTGQALGAHHTVNKELLDSASTTTEIAGMHLIADFWGAQLLQDVDHVESALIGAAKDAGATLIHLHLHQFSTEGGITGVALLAESHISVHTWPENNFAAFDVFMCGGAEPQKAVDYLVKMFKPEKVMVKALSRG